MAKRSSEGMPVNSHNLLSIHCLYPLFLSGISVLRMIGILISCVIICCRYRLDLFLSCFKRKKHWMRHSLLSYAETDEWISWKHLLGLPWAEALQVEDDLRDGSHYCSPSTRHHLLSWSILVTSGETFEDLGPFGCGEGRDCSQVKQLKRFRYLNFDKYILMQTLSVYL